MNWQEIKEKYPKAYELFIKFVNELHNSMFKLLEIDDTDDLIIKHSYGINSDLYDFFDDNEIKITTTLWQKPGDISYIIYTKEKKGTYKSNGMSKGHQIRKEAEIAAFEKAFEILEERL